MLYDRQIAVVCFRHRQADRQGVALFVFPFLCVRIQDTDLCTLVSSLLRIIAAMIKTTTFSSIINHYITIETII